ncbi:MAG TPA: DUF1289 domain-containing protein [Candidatus Aquabacterium excrementipullorum]|nr:DUF1289 domain-containing protein [Candidatus Aquabacterium excrementipullorum]
MGGMSLSLPSSPAPVASPCVRRCTLDQDDVCVGCGRTLDDIRQWGEMTEAQRAECVARAEVRRRERDWR